MKVEHLMYASSFMRAKTCIIKHKGAYNGKLMYFQPQNAIFLHIMHLFEIIMLLEQLVQV